MNRTRLLCALSLAVSLGACSSGTGAGPDGGSGACAQNRDCASDQVCLDQGGGTKACVTLCRSSADCHGGQVCADQLCTSPGCSTSADCPAGQVCAAGACGAPLPASAAASCTLAPPSALLHAGGQLRLLPLVRDAGGKVLPFTGLSWSASGPGSVDQTGLVTAATGAGALSVTATLGAARCSAALTVLAAASGLRVVVIDADTKQPVSGAFVVLGNDLSTKARTDAAGTAQLSAPAGPRDVHVFAAGHGYTSYLGVSGNDLLVALQPYVPVRQRAGFNGTLTADDFASLPAVGQLAHLAFFGSGVSNSLLDFSFDTLLGPLRPVSITLTGSPITLNLPSGLVFGFDTNLFGTGDFLLYADPGPRVLWGLGGNLDSLTTLRLLGPLLKPGAKVDLPSLLPQVLPLLGQLQSGVLVGVEPGPPVTPPAGPSFQRVSVPLGLQLKLRAQAQVPTLPQQGGQYVDGVVALVGAGAFPLGFVPLGVSGGLAAKDASGNRTGKVLDPSCDTSGSSPCDTSLLPLHIAPESGGLEGSPYQVALLAVSFAGLAPGSLTGVAISAVLQSRGSIPFVADGAPATPIPFTGRSFPALPAPSSVSLTKATRQIALTADADPSTQVYRFEVENAARLSWNLWMDRVGASPRRVTLLDPSQVDPSLVDPLADAMPQEGGAVAPSGGRLIGLSTSDPQASFSSLTGFGGLTLDALGNSLQSFTVSSVAAQ